jgi:hypothetical protein
VDIPPEHPTCNGGPAVLTDSTGDVNVGLSVTGVVASIWAGIFGITAVVAKYVEGTDWYQVLKMAYFTGFVLTVTAFLFYYGVLGMLSDPMKRPINGPVQYDTIPYGDGDQRVVVLYHRELPIDAEENRKGTVESG